MPKTAVALFENPDVVDRVVREIEALGIPRKEVRTMEEPKTFEITGVMSFPRLDFEVDLRRELSRIGASKAEADDYVEGLRQGGVLVFATASDDTVDAAAAVMNRYGAVDLEESSGPEPDLPHIAAEGVPPIHDAPVSAGRIRQTGEVATFFVW